MLVAFCSCLNITLIEIVNTFVPYRSCIFVRDGFEKINV